MSQKILNKRSSVFNKTPLPSQMEYGEIAINFNHENPFLSILDSKGEIQKFLSETKTRNLIAGVKNDIDASFYTKAQINQMFEDLESGGTISFDDYYTKAETDAKYQSLSGMSSYLTVASAEGLYQPIGDYALVSQLPDTSGYAQKSDLDDYLTISSANTIFATKEELEEHIPTVDAYTKAESDSKFQSQSGMTDYVLKSELPSTTGLASEAWVSQNFSTTAHTHDYSEIQNTPDLSGFASLSDIPDASNFVTSAFTDATYAKKGEVPSDVYTKAETDTLLAGKANSAHTHTMSEITDLDVPKTWRGTLAQYNNLTEIDNDTLYIITDSSEQLVTSGDVESMISGYTNLTEVQTLLEGYSTTAHTHDYSEIQNTPDLSGFASLSDIPDASNFVTSAFTDATYAKKGEVPSDVYTKAETDTLLAGKANSAHTHTMSEITDLDVPKTWRGTLAQYNNLTEIDNDTLYIITDSSEQLVTSGDVESMISGYTNLTEVQTLLEGYSTTAHTHDYSEIQNTPDLSGFASLSDIPDTSNFITSAFTEEHYMKIGSTPTDVYTKAESDSKFQAISAMTEYSQTGHTHDYETLTNKPDLSIYLTEHQDISGLATKQELENYMPNSGMTDYALKSEIPSIEGLATEAELANYQPVSAMTGYSTTAHTHSNYAEKSELANYQPVSGMNDYALASQIPSTAGLASETWVSQNFQPQSGMTNYALSGHTHSEYLTQTSADSRYARVVSCTQAQYDVLVQNDQVEQGVLYCIIETSN